MAAFLIYNTEGRPCFSFLSSTTPLGRGRSRPFQSDFETTTRTQDDVEASAQLMSPDDFMRRPNLSAGIGTNSSVALPKFWDGDADLFLRLLKQFFG